MLISLAFLALLALAACQVQSASTTGEQGELGSPLVPADPAVFEAYMKSALHSLGDPSAEVFVGDGTVFSLPTQRMGSPEALFSTTNLQTAGVDESDPVKFDGQYLFVSRPPELVFVPPPIEPSPLPGSRFAPDFFYPEYEVEKPAEVAIYLAESDPTGAEERSIITLDGPVQIHGLVLLPAEDALPPLLVVIATEGGTLSTRLDFVDPWAYGEGLVHIWIFDIDDPETPVEQLHLRFEGMPLAVRRIGDQLTLVTRFSPYLRTLSASAFDAESRSEAVDDATLEDLLPRSWVDDAYGAGFPLVTPDRCFVPHERSDAEPAYFYHPTLVSITAIDLRDPDERVSICAAGPADRIFSSTQALYLASSVYGHLAETVVHKFRYSEAGPRFRGSARVAGRPGGTQLNFGMGEHEDVFGIMTTVNVLAPDGQGFRSEHRLTLLREAGDGTLRLSEASHLPNEREPARIGKPDENLHAVRFVGDRVYAVTFRKVDPLYVIDIEDADAPFIAGELAVPGFSDFLQPLGDDLLLGIGKDTVPDVNNDWFQGVKIELFDVSDPSEPVSADARVVGRRGSDTAARTDHQAVSVLAGGDSSYRVTIPIRVHEELPDGRDPTDPRTYYGWTHTGLHFFEIDASGPSLTASGVLTIASVDDPDPGSSVGTRGDRSRLQDRAVHYIHDGRVWSAAWDAPLEAVGPQ
jgi:hypothetical protein